MSDDEDWGELDMGSDDDMGVMIKSESLQQVSDKMTAKAQHYKTLNLNDVSAKILQIVEQVSNTLHLPEWHTTLVLRYFQWNQQKAVETFLQCSDIDGLLRKSGVSTDAQCSKPRFDSGEFECPMCYDDVNVKKSFYLECGHQICNQCWEDYIVQSIGEGRACVIMQCPHYQCPIIAQPSVISKFIHPQKYPRLLQRYQRFSLQSYIEHNLWLSFCPAPNCSYVIECDPGIAVNVTCQCGHASCSSCKLESHRPANCLTARKWIAKFQADSENVQWILAKTKKCPRCKVPIEKNQGCNHMSCRECNFEFCWLCKGEWSQHGSATGGFYKCNIYDSKKAKGVVSSEEKSQAEAASELERFSFYFTRYENHLKSIRHAQDTYMRCAYKLEKLAETKQWNADDGKYLTEAVDIIVVCRRLLSWTYPIGFYLRNNFTQRQLFEDLQQQLEKYTEGLHELLEDPNVFSKSKRGEIINFTRVTKQFRINMILGIENEMSVDLDHLDEEEYKS